MCLEYNTYIIYNSEVITMSGGSVQVEWIVSGGSFER